MTPPSLSPWDLSLFTALTTLGASRCTNLSAAQRLGEIRIEERGSDISQLFFWPYEWLCEEPLVSLGPLVLEQHRLDTGRDTMLTDDHVALGAC